jgi:hypothetical protein
MRRIKYDRGDISSTMNAALKLAKLCKTVVYIEATAYGFYISQRKPPIWTPYYKITPEGEVSIERKR